MTELEATLKGNISAGSGINVSPSGSGGIESVYKDITGTLIVMGGTPIIHTGIQQQGGAVRNAWLGEDVFDTHPHGVFR